MDLRTYREANGLTLQQMAERLGVSHARTVQRYESGRIPRPAVMLRILALTGGQVQPSSFYAVPPMKRGRKPRAAAEAAA